MTELTELGDLAIAAAVSFVVAVWLWVCVGRAFALAFAGGFAGLVVLVAALKVFTRALAPAYVPGDVLGLSTGAPSGHAALSLFVYGSIAAIFARFGAGLGRAAGVGLGAAVIAVVAISRVTLRHHTAGDVAAGLAVAAGCLLLFDRYLRTAEVTSPAPVVTLLAVVILVATLALASGLRLPSTRFL